MSGDRHCFRSHLILVVDDHEALRSATARVLDYLGHDYILADNGAQALDIFFARSNEITLILLDLHMPHLNGKEVLRQIRDDGHDVTVILCSSDPFCSLEKALQMGADHYLSKPVRLVTLRNAIAAV